MIGQRQCENVHLVSHHVHLEERADQARRTNYPPDEMIVLGTWDEFTQEEFDDPCADILIGLPDGERSPFH